MSNPKQPSSDDIVSVHFRDSGVVVGGSIIGEWSKRQGETDQIKRYITVEDRGPLGVLLRFDNGALKQEIDVPRTMIKQITRDVKR